MGKRICAYCSNKNNLTREHIFPKFLLDYHSDYISMYYPKAEPKLRIGKKELIESKIKDVCNNCNNIKLATLDKYASSFVKKYCLEFIIPPKDYLEIKYDYDLLLRWLLKISYNQSRIEDIKSIRYEIYKSYIINGDSKPEYLSLIVGLIKPYYLKDNDKNIVSKNLLELGYIPPAYLRITDNPIEIKLIEYYGIFLLKMISINSLVFLLYEYIEKKNLIPLKLYTNFQGLDSNGFSRIPFSIYDTLSFMDLHVSLTQEDFKKRKNDFLKFQ